MPKVKNVEEYYHNVKAKYEEKLRASDKATKKLESSSAIAERSRLTLQEHQNAHGSVPPWLAYQGTPYPFGSLSNRTTILWQNVQLLEKPIIEEIFLYLLQDFHSLTKGALCLNQPKAEPALKP